MKRKIDRKYFSFFVLALSVLGCTPPTPDDGDYRVLECITVDDIDVSSGVGASKTSERDTAHAVENEQSVVQDSLPTTFEADLEFVLTPPEVAISFQFAPDGRLFYTERDTGKIRIIKDSIVLEAPEFALPVNSVGGERGLLGIALHPSFVSNGFVYVYYTRSASGQVVSGSVGDEQGRDLESIRLSRLQVQGDEVVGPEVVLVDFPADPARYSHYGGNIHFGPDGKLYVSQGDLTFDVEAQSLEGTNGKILRYNDDGSIPEDNPFGVDNPIWALGFRNSFDFTFDPISRQIFATENSTFAHDELNLIIKGGNYGWPAMEGCVSFDDSLDLVHGEPIPALLDLAPEPPAVAPTGIAFAPNDYYGPDTAGDLFYCEFNTSNIYRIKLSPSRNAVVSRHLFSNTAAFDCRGAIELVFDSDGVLFVSTGFCLLRAVPAGSADSSTE